MDFTIQIPIEMEMKIKLGPLSVRAFGLPKETTIDNQLDARAADNLMMMNQQKNLNNTGGSLGVPALNRLSGSSRLSGSGLPKSESAVKPFLGTVPPINLSTVQRTSGQGLPKSESAVKPFGTSQPPGASAAKPPSSMGKPKGLPAAKPRSGKGQAPNWGELKAKITKAIKNDEEPEVFEALAAEMSNFMTAAKRTGGLDEVSQIIFEDATTFFARKRVLSEDGSKQALQQIIDMCRN